MKKISAIIAAITLPIVAYSQVGEYRNTFSVGFNGGMAINSVSFSPSIKQKSHMGPTFGLTARYTCEKYIKALCSLQMEINYANVGWQEDIDPVTLEDGTTRQDTYKRSMNHIQVPLLARMAWGRENNGLQFFFLAGPQINYCFSESESMNFDPSDENLSSYRASGVTEQYGKMIDNKLDYGIAAGAGLELNTSIGHFALEGRYYYGLGDFYGNSKKDPFSRSAHGTIYAKASYLIDLVNPTKEKKK